jgi:hypothetical protein
MFGIAPAVLVLAVLVGGGYDAPVALVPVEPLPVELLPPQLLNSNTAETMITPR